MDIAVSTSQLVFAVIGIVLLLAALIIGVRAVFRSRANSDLAGQQKGKSSGSPLQGRAKYPQVDAFGLSGTFFNVGLAAALGLTVLAFGVTQYEEQVYIPDDALKIEEDIEVEPPRTAEPPPPPPPPPPPVIEEVPNEELLEEEEVEFVDQSVDEESFVEAPPVVEEKAPPPPPPPPPPPKQEADEIFKVVEQMPRFPGCENQGGSDAEKKACSDKKMLEFIYKNIKYPAIARENGVEGTVVVQFVVDKDGSISNAKVVRDIGAQCGDEALRVVNLMNQKNLKWTPGKQRGRPVRVQFNLPVKFRLE